MINLTVSKYDDKIDFPRVPFDILLRTPDHFKNYPREFSLINKNISLRTIRYEQKKIEEVFFFVCFWVKW